MTLPAWISGSRGDAPRLEWSASLEDALAAFTVCREPGATIACDASGGLYHFRRDGTLGEVSRGYREVSTLDWSDVGRSGVVVTEREHLCWLDVDFTLQWSRTLPSDILAVAVDSFGHYVAVALVNHTTFVFRADKTCVGEFETPRPLAHLKFVSSQPRLIGAAEYGLLTSHTLDGTQIWAHDVWASIGDLALTGDGDVLFVAGFTHGVRIFDADGDPAGTYILQDEPHRVSCSYWYERLAAATIERHVCWLDQQGDCLWDAQLADGIHGLHCDPLAGGLTIGLDCGRLACLRWDH